MTERKRVLVAGIGNAWLSDDGFGGAVARRLEERGLPDHAWVSDFGTGGLDLAYELMQGYDALVIVDVSRQGGEPGTLYVIEPDMDEVPGEIEEGQMIDPHAMDPATVLQFVKAIGSWPGRVVIIACEPETVEQVGLTLSPVVAEAVDRAADLVVETLEDLSRDGAYQGA